NTLDRDGDHRDTFRTGDELIFEIQILTLKRLEDVVISFGIFTFDQLLITSQSTEEVLPGLTLDSPRILRCHVKCDALMPGNFSINVKAHKTGRIIFKRYKAATFSIRQDEGMPIKAGLFDLPCVWMNNV
ncbi:MAG: Wzt carbohydrate-binding domain-containing protein, partial [Deltaproteobacteria bacterium]|nr:Wzt carbohydrate-binding domain-containing protein [Deltaproteobacteria bacterium]